MNKPFVSIAVIVNDNYDYLLIQRANEPYKGKWSFIGGIGASKKGLPPEEAVLDEVNYDIGVEFLGNLCFDYPLHNVDYADRVYVFLGKVAEEAIRLNPKAASEMKWFTNQELGREDDLAFDNKWILDMMRDFVDQLRFTQEGV